MQTIIEIPEVVPSLLELDQARQTLYLNTVGEYSHITSQPWSSININQSVTVYINNISAGTAPPVLSADGTEVVPPRFAVETHKYFQAGTNAAVYLAVTQPDGSPNPNSKNTKTLTFPVVADSLSDELKIDITEGAAGYSDQRPSLLPANVAVIRGPANMELEALSGGAVRFQDVGGAESCIFSFDENGRCPLVLIRIDSLRASGVLAAVPDSISLVRRGETDVLIKKPVVFGDYIPATGDAALAFNSVSCNTIGIADGQTICIVSIVMKNPALNDKLYIKLDAGLKLADRTFSNRQDADTDLNLPSTMIVNGMAEFGVTADSPGTYSVGAFPQSQTAAYLTNSIEFRSLSGGALS
ncbi:hypothetical protein BR10RB9215_C20867 [Brucella sp. 10RB9215]|uniref:glyceraldehyde-3-phosphate dehydrogenase n=1 Tax=Brucella sp. 10RB9215 TaxID=1149953 RepID=UPI00090A56E0|nr:glyceraldehyde-3-phosphate dehydrogenase [Brucella sp. 10RB9215]SBW16196.1 hypothetical protein BR10RB9215_C20867 [Brucella sp. 10RB9215]